MASRPLGYRRILVVLFLCDLACLAAAAVMPYPLVGLLYLVLSVMGMNYVYKDALAINKERGARVIDATVWSFLSIFTVATLPIYLAIRRDPGRRDYLVPVMVTLGVLELLGAVRLFFQPLALRLPGIPAAERALIYDSFDA